MSRRHEAAIWGEAIGATAGFCGATALAGTFLAAVWNESWSPDLVRWGISSVLALVFGAGLYFASEYVEPRWRDNPVPTPPPSPEREEKERRDG